jgi:hypothetical protein
MLLNKLYRPVIARDDRAEEWGAKRDRGGEVPPYGAWRNRPIVRRMPTVTTPKRNAFSFTR